MHGETYEQAKARLARSMFPEYAKEYEIGGHRFLTAAACYSTRNGNGCRWEGVVLVKPDYSPFVYSYARTGACRSSHGCLRQLARIINARRREEAVATVERYPHGVTLTYSTFQG